MKNFNYSFAEEKKDRITYEYSPEADEKLDVEIENGIPIVGMNRAGLITLAKILIKMAKGDYSDGFHVHLRKDFNADLPETLIVMLNSKVAKDSSHE